MKKTAHAFIVLFILVLVLSPSLPVFAQPGTVVIVGDCGYGEIDPNIEGTYVYWNDVGGRHQYQKASTWFIWATAEGWKIQHVSAGGTPYTHSTISDNPPQTGWVSTDAGYDPPPTLSGDGSLSVELASFFAQLTDQGIQLQWVTESELDNTGYILERKTAVTGWSTIAGYETHDVLRSKGNTSTSTEYTFMDVDVLAGEAYTYRLSDVDIHGNVTVCDALTITLDALPEKTELLPATPNPFNPSTKISYTLAEDSDITLLVTDMLGRTVQTIIQSRHQTAGSYSIHWNGRTDAGLNAASGTYFLILEAGAFRKMRKVMLVR